MTYTFIHVTYRIVGYKKTIMTWYTIQFSVRHIWTDLKKNNQLHFTVGPQIRLAICSSQQLVMPWLRNEASFIEKYTIIFYTYSQSLTKLSLAVRGRFTTSEPSYTTFHSRISCSSVVEHPNSVRKVTGSTPVGRTQIFFSEWPWTMID